MRTDVEYIVKYYYDKDIRVMINSWTYTLAAHIIFRVQDVYHYAGKSALEIVHYCLSHIRYYEDTGTYVKLEGYSWP